MNITRIFYFIIAVALGIVFYTQYQLSTRLENLNNSIQNLYLTNNKDLKQINNLIFESHFKDDLILNNFNTSTNTIIAFFTALIALGAVFSFKKIDEDIKELKESATTIEETANEVKEAKSIIEKTAIEVENSKNKTIQIKEEINLIRDSFLLSKSESFLNNIFFTSNLLIIYANEKKEREVDAYFFSHHISKILFDLSAFQEFIDLSKNNISENTEKALMEAIKSSRILTTNSLKAILNFCKEGEVSFTGGKANFILILLQNFNEKEYYQKALENDEIEKLFTEIITTLQQYKRNYEGNPN